MPKTIQKILKLTLGDWSIIFLSLILLPLFSLLLKLFGFDKTKNKISLYSNRPPPDETLAELHLQEAKQIAYAIAIAAKYGPYRATCLPVSLLLKYLLNWKGIHCKLNIGVNRDQPDLKAHAWIEVYGQPVIDSDVKSGHFSPFSSGKLND